MDLHYQHNDLSEKLNLKKILKKNTPIPDFHSICYVRARVDSNWHRLHKFVQTLMIHGVLV